MMSTDRDKAWSVIEQLDLRGDLDHVVEVFAAALATVRRETWAAAIRAAESSFEGGGEVTHRHIEVGRAIVVALESAKEKDGTS